MNLEPIPPGICFEESVGSFVFFSELQSVPRRRQFSAQCNQSVCNLAKAAMPLQKQVSQLSESEDEHESVPEVDLFEIWVEIIKPGLRQSQAHPCEQEAETEENSGPSFSWPN